MQCIQAAIHHQLEAMARLYPKQKPVIITFSSTLQASLRTLAKNY